MQTVKNAAIVIFLMTVTYSAYLSLTAPPDTLPGDVQDLVFDNDQGVEIDPGLPASLNELAIHTGEVSDGYDPSNSPSSTLQSRAAPHVPTSSGVQQSPVATASIAPPKVDDGYPSTSNTFDLPDPTAVASSFVPSGQKLDLPATGSVPFALASSKSDSGNGIALPSPDVPTGADSSSAGSNLGLANAIRTADRQYAKDQLPDALATLSIFYNTPNISGEQRAEMLSRLDPLAREVIYSRRHLLDQSYRVSGRETLPEIAQQYDVPWQLLANINQVKDPLAMIPGTELKVVRGPFRAQVDLTQKELTVFLGDLYGGRFPIEVGSDPAPEAGTYTIQDKQTSRTFYTKSGSPVPPDSPENPYGNVWMDLGGQMCIHGSPNTTSPSAAGCISLAGDYAADLYGILSQGSSVTIRR